MRIAAALLAATVLAAPLGAQANDADRSVKGGITLAGWKGRIDARAASQGKTINDSKFGAEGKDLRLSVGPAAYYWNDANVARGEYVVKAMFHEHKMVQQHPHAYGLFIGGAKLGTDDHNLLYCIVYGNGNYAVKHFWGKEVHELVKLAPSPAVKKADGSGMAMNEVAWRVAGGKVDCLVNGQSVWSASKADIVGPQKLESTDGIYGIRVSHNVELSVSGLALTKP
jgi:hypothetical protein